MSDSSQPPPPPPPPESPGDEYGAHPPDRGGRGMLIAIVVGSVFALLAVVVTAVVVVKVLGGQDPEDVATEFLEESLAVNVHLEGDPEKICELTAEGSRESLLSGFEAEDCAEFAEQREDALQEQRDAAADQCDDADGIRSAVAWDIAITGVEEDGDEATVAYEISYEFDGDESAVEACGGDPDRFDDVEEGELDLVNEDGDWKVAG